MGPGNYGVRRVVVGNVVLMLLHCYFAALAQPQPSPSSPFVDFVCPDTLSNNRTGYDGDSCFTIEGRISEAATETQRGNVSYTVQNSDFSSTFCTVPGPAGNSTLYDTPADTEFTCYQSTPFQFKPDNTTSTSVLSFATQFIVSMYTPSPGGPSSNTSEAYNDVTNGLQGFTFALLPLDFNPSGASDGGYLGLLNATSNGSNQTHIVAVEFDFKGNPEFSDPVEGYHIAVNIDSMNSTSWTFLPGPAPNIQLWTLHVWIDYDGTSNMLTVTTLDISSAPGTGMNFKCATDPDTRPPALGSNLNAVGAWTSHRQKVDLSSVLNEFMYVGFTSSLTSLVSYAYPSLQVNTWSFRTSNSSPPAPSAPFSCPQAPRPPFFIKYAFVFTLTVVLSGLLALSVLYATSYMYYSRWVERRGWRFNIDDDHLGATDPHKFTYKELALATNNFDGKHALGRGGFGSVYKGFLPGNKQDVAVKRVSAESKQGEREFLAEVMIIGKLRHRNLVRLQGWCHERGELLLVYDYMPNGSVDKLLFDNHVKPQDSPSRSLANRRLDETVSLKNFGVDSVDPKFPWERRLKVIVDVAKALVYLHTECEERIIHRDVKAANVMLDAKFNARLGDFGLARAYNHSLLTPESTNVAGTFGYLAPELFHTGKQTEKTDVYSFGAFLLEIACGRKPIFHEGDEVGVLVDHVWRMWGDSRILDSADGQLEGMFDEGEMRKVLCLGLVCSHPSPATRPSMRQVLCILTGEIGLPDVPSTKPRVGEELERSLSEDMLTSTESNSQSYSPRARVRMSGMADGLPGVELSNWSAFRGGSAI